jgi:hypothetical protein
VGSVFDVGKCCLFSCDWAVVGGMGFMRVWVVNHTSNKVYQFLAFGAGDNIIRISPRLHISTSPKFVEQMVFVFFFIRRFQFCI